MSSLEDQVVDLKEDPAVKIEPWPRWVRAFVNGRPVVDSKRVLLVTEPGALPVFYFPREDVRMELLTRNDRAEESRHLGEATVFDLAVDDRTQQHAAWSYENPPKQLAAMKSHIAFRWDKLDTWFEEDEEVFVHPRSPYHRVDVLNSSRHIRVELGGVTVAETRRPRLLFETGLPTRYYIPKVDARMDLLIPTDLRTRCPYKGEAVYWTAEIDGQRYEDVVWSYPAPIPECPKIEGLLCFYNERADIFVEGELQQKPKTKWSTAT
jgi:uncharacterized protein (DUF427 family)